MYFIGVYTVERFSQRHGFDRLGTDMRCSAGLSKPRKTTLYSALKIVNQRNAYLNKKQSLRGALAIILYMLDLGWQRFEKMESTYRCYSSEKHQQPAVAMPVQEQIKRRKTNQ